MYECKILRCSGEKFLAMFYGVRSLSVVHPLSFTPYSLIFCPENCVFFEFCFSVYKMRESLEVSLTNPSKSLRSIPARQIPSRKIFFCLSVHYIQLVRINASTRILSVLKNLPQKFNSRDKNCIRSRHGSLRRLCKTLCWVMVIKRHERWGWIMQKLKWYKKYQIKQSERRKSAYYRKKSEAIWKFQAKRPPKRVHYAPNPSLFGWDWIIKLIKIGLCEVWKRASWRLLLCVAADAEIKVKFHYFVRRQRNKKAEKPRDSSPGKDKANALWRCF